MKRRHAIPSLLFYPSRPYQLLVSSQVTQPSRASQSLADGPSTIKKGWSWNCFVIHTYIHNHARTDPELRQSKHMGVVFALTWTPWNLGYGSWWSKSRLYKSEETLSASTGREVLSILQCYLERVCRGHPDWLMKLDWYYRSERRIDIHHDPVNIELVNRIYARIIENVSTLFDINVPLI